MEEDEITAEGAADAAAAAGEAQGLPQLDFATWPNQIFWLIVALVAIYLILSKVALPRIGTILTDRQGAITNDIAAAEELKLQAQEAERAYEQALADARAEAGRIAERQRQEMKAELDEAMARADAEIAEKTAESDARIAEIRQSAMQSVEQVAKDTAGAVVAALGAQAGQDEIDRAVEAQLKG